MSSPGQPLHELQAALGNSYTLERELGRGGMATVYLARDERNDRHVALKVLHAGIAAPQGAERFLREIEIAGRLSHPNILPVLDSGQIDDVPFYVMPFVDGETLTDRIAREHKLGSAAAVAIATGVLDALSFAHEMGVIHRDIKPDNIMLSGMRTFVADFGIGKALGWDHSSLTQTGMALGTPAYMSLEQAAGDPDLDARSDLYSLALVLYEMLAGQPPFVGATPQAIIAARFTQTVPSLCDGDPDVSPALDAAIRRALSRRRDDRFPTAGEFAAAINPM